MWVTPWLRHPLGNLAGACLSRFITDVQPSVAFTVIVKGSAMAEADRERPKRLIFRRYRTDPRTGRVLDARHYGLRAWPIWIDHEDS